MNDRDIKVLLIEDNPADARLIAEALAEVREVPFNLEYAYNLSTGLEHLAKSDRDVVLLDLLLPDSEGFDTFLKARIQAPKVPIIVLTGLNDEALAIRLIHEGAQDYLIKGLMNSGMLLRSIRYAIERKQVEEALRQSEERYRSLVETARDVIFTLSPIGTITSLNPIFETITGWASTEWLGKSISSIVHPDDLSFAIELFQQTLQGHMPTIFELRVLSNSGEYIIAEFTATPQIQDAKVVGVLGIARDITKQKRMEEELLKAQKLESLGVLAGGIAHDFNNILTVIIGNVSLAKMLLNPEDKLYKRLREVENACFKAKDLSQQLVTFSKGGAPVKKIASIGQLIKDSTSFALSGSNVSCEFSVSKDLWRAEVDEVQISRVIHNLVRNAEQAMPDGGVIRVRAENTNVVTGDELPLKEGRYIKVMIDDEGVGISEKDIPKIFDPYFTASKKGSGLGLTVVYSIIKNHDGYIGLESQLGVGTTFCLYLLASQEEAQPGGESEQTHVIGKKRILVMDDDENIRKLAEDALTYIGYEVELAGDGGEAIELYQKAKESGRPFDAVIMDLTIPGGMGGKEVVTRLLESQFDVKAIASSGYSNDPVMSEFKKYGFKGVIPKPYNIEDLKETLYKVINEP